MTEYKNQDQMTVLHSSDAGQVIYVHSFDAEVELGINSDYRYFFRRSLTRPLIYYVGKTEEDKKILEKEWAETLAKSDSKNRFFTEEAFYLTPPSFENFRNFLNNDIGTVMEADDDTLVTAFSEDPSVILNLLEDTGDGAFFAVNYSKMYDYWHSTFKIDQLSRVSELLNIDVVGGFDHLGRPDVWRVLDKDQKAEILAMTLVRAYHEDKIGELRLSHHHIPVLEGNAEEYQSFIQNPKSWIETNMMGIDNNRGLTAEDLTV